jgi:hypothetical protein
MAVYNEYISNRLRGRAQELASEDLGPRPEYDVMRQRQREVMPLPRVGDSPRFRHLRHPRPWATG